MVVSVANVQSCDKHGTEYIGLSVASAAESRRTFVGKKPTFARYVTVKSGRISSSTRRCKQPKPSGILERDTTTIESRTMMSTSLALLSCLEIQKIALSGFCMPQQAKRYVFRVLLLCFRRLVPFLIRPLPHCTEHTC